jgi:diphosphate-dependent phosphofructokinase
MLDHLSELRKAFEPPVCHDLEDLTRTSFKKEGDFLLAANESRTFEPKQLNIGVMFSGGPASGGHNVVWGLFEGLRQMNPDSKLFGFLAGPGGFLRGDTKELTSADIDAFKNQGGFHMLGSSRDKIESKEQFTQAFATVEKYELDALVFIGGDDTNTNAYILSQEFEKLGIECSVIGIPKTIDGDLRGENLEISFGFDTACKVYSEMIGNICTDAPSSRKYTHFIKLMGRKASHVTLECAMATQPNLAFIAEEVEAQKMTLASVVDKIVEVVLKRSEKGLHYGVILIPEGLIEFLSDFKKLIRELESQKLEEDSKLLFEELDSRMQHQLLHDRDPHGNIELSHIATEDLLIDLTKKRLESLGYDKFHPTKHFYGYEGRCAMPSNFDATYCYNLGLLASSMAQHGITARMASFKGLDKPASQWRALCLDLKAMMVHEMRHGKNKLVIEKALVDLEGALFQEFIAKRGQWQLEDCYLNPGPIQFFGSASEGATKTVLAKN